MKWHIVWNKYNFKVHNASMVSCLIKIFMAAVILKVLMTSPGVHYTKCNNHLHLLIACCNNLCLYLYSLSDTKPLPTTEKKLVALWTDGIWNYLNQYLYAFICTLQVTLFLFSYCILNYNRFLNFQIIYLFFHISNKGNGQTHSEKKITLCHYATNNSLSKLSEIIAFNLLILCKKLYNIMTTLRTSPILAATKLYQTKNKQY